MQVLFGTAALDRACRTIERRKERWGSSAREVARRLFELTAVATLSDVGLLPGVTLVADDSPGCYRMQCVRGVTVFLRPLGPDGSVIAASAEHGTATVVSVDDVKILEI